MTYDQLVAAIQAWTENDAAEFTATAVMDLIIDLAELRIFKENDLVIARKTATGSITTGTLAVPADIVRPRWIQLTTGGMLQQKDESFIKEFTATSGVPRFYSWSGDGSANFLITPTATAATAVDIGYTYRPTGLSSSNTTSWLGTNYPDVLLYASLLEAELFMKGEQQGVSRWVDSYKKSAGEMMLEEARRMTDSYRAGELRPSA